jgi:hypothetical protein
MYRVVFTEEKEKQKKKELYKSKQFKGNYLPRRKNYYKIS